MTRLEIEHKTEQIGASFDTDYEVILQCVPDCPACAAQAQLQKVVEWGEGECPHFGKHFAPTAPTKKHRCVKCWQELRQGAHCPFGGDCTHENRLKCGYLCAPDSEAGKE